MLAAPAGGSSGGTDWSTRDVKFMWAVLADQDTEIHFGVVGGWQKMSDLINEHISRMTRYREELAAVWPPEKSRASAAYIAQLDGLIGHLRGTLDAAAANYQAFSTVTLTLARARIKMQRILAKYEANERLIQAWQANPKPTPAPSPAGILQPPPVSPAHQEQLNNEARTIMYDLSAAILSGQANLKHPAPYQSNIDSSGAVDDQGNAPGIPRPSSASTPPTSARISESTSAHPTIPVPPSYTGTPGVNPGNGGPILGGTGPNPATNPPPNITQIPPPTPAPEIIGPPTAPIFGPNTRPPHTGSATPAGSPSRTGSGGGGPATREPIPSGGVIGAVPGSGMIGQLPSGSQGQATGSSRAIPLGGVIGQQITPPAGIGARRGADGHLDGHSRSGWTAPSHSQGRSDERERWNLDNPWETDKGVDPVIFPPKDPGPIDPGPAIGISR